MLNIGDRVKVRSFASIPANRITKVAGDSPILWSNRKATACDKLATVSDSYESTKYGVTVYKILIDGRREESKCLFLEEDLEILEPALPEWDIQFEQAENLVVAKLYINGKIKAQGHGHVFHEGTEGYIQAASYAVKKIWQSYCKRGN